MSSQHGHFAVVVLVAIWVLFNAFLGLVLPVVKHFVAKYEHHKMIEARRKEFYAGILAMGNRSDLWA